MKALANYALPRLLAVISILPGSNVMGDDPPVAQDPPLDYYSWEIANGITGSGANADSDGDGIPNGIEFVIGGDPSGPDSDSNHLLPTVTVDTTYLTFMYRRIEDATDYDLFVEYSSSLGNWIEAQGGVDGVDIEDTLEFEPGVTLVTVKIPRDLASGSSLFAHLRVEITP